MAPRIELNPARAFEAVREMDDARLGGERPRVLVSDVRGLSPQFVESLMQRDDIELVITEDDRDTGKAPLQESPVQAGVGAWVAAAALILALASIGVGLMLAT